jgi:phosphocarrier protein HPr
VADVTGPSRRRVELINRSGLHLRAASLFVQVSRQFQAKVRVSCNGILADGRSILELMLLGAECGTTLELEATGLDAEHAVAALLALIEAGFHDVEAVSTGPENPPPSRGPG